MQGGWQQVRGKAKGRWRNLTDDDLDVIDGKRDQFVGKLRERYGVEKEEAERDVDEFARSID